MRGPKRLTRRLAILAGVALAASVVVTASPAVAAPAGTSPVGTAPVLPAQAVVEDNVAPTAPLQLTVALRPRDEAGLAALARSVSIPGSPTYRQFLAPGEFGPRFGPTDATIAEVRQALTNAGLQPGALSANRLAISVTTTAGAAARAFGVHFHHVRLPSGRVAFANDAAPRLAAVAAPAIAGIIGLDNLALDHPDWRAPTTPAPTTSPATPTPPAPAPTVPGASPTAPHLAAALTGPQPCSAAVNAGGAWGGYTANQLSQAYSFGGLYAKNVFGAGVTIAVYELAAYNRNDVAAFQACYGTTAQVTDILVDGGPNAADGGGIEVELDIEGIVSMAPKANVAVYLGPNGSGTYDVYNRIVSDDTAAVISTSWGNCEAARTAAHLAQENTLFQQAAVQGQTVVASSGDGGSEDCSGSTALGVDDPSAQPFVTGVGGTNLTALGPKPTEGVWNEAVQQIGAGGGGISRAWQMPAAQHGTGVVNSYSSRTPCNSPVGTVCRQVPDVSASADPMSGYMIYYTGSESGSAGWQSIGGTSAAAPLWAALAALADQNCACSLGFLSPALYNAAAAAPASFNDVTTVGNNDYLNAHSGAYPTSAGYDMATGLGTPAATALAAQLGPQPTAPALIAANPPSTGAVNSPYTYTFVATGRPSPTFSVASGTIPTGLALNATTGVLSGAPTTTGTFVFTVAAGNGVGSPAVSPGITVTVGQARFTNPTNGQANVDTTQPFTWSPLAQAQGYVVVVGTTQYGSDLVNSGILAPTVTAAAVPALPTGRSLYATLVSEVNGAWTSFQNITFTAAPGLATFSFPGNGQANIDSTRPFTWAAIPQAQGYILVVGTAPYGSNLANSGVLPPTQSSFPLPAPLPTGKTIYATLLTEVNGAFTRYQAITFTAGPAMATFTRPLNGQLRVTTPGAFTWATIAGAQNYILVVGTTLYGSDLVNSGILAASQSSFSVPKLPTDKLLYATILTLVNGAWVFQAIGFTAS
jgi:subtilase family serine protease